MWLLTDDDESLLCMLQYELSKDLFTSGDKIPRMNCPRYFDLIRSRRVIVAEDARHDERTAELLPYLESANIGALLDAPIYRDGAVIGVVCHEHIGGTRHWAEKEAGFASAVADMLTILIEQAERAELRAAIDEQRQLESQHQKMQALSRLGRVVVHDLSNVLTVASLRAGVLDSEPDIAAATEDIQQVLRYGNELLRQLRDFCEERQPTASVEVVEAMRSMGPVLTALLGKGIEFSLSCDISPTHLSISKVEFEQLVLNLCMNAKDAIPGAGRVSVRVTKQPDQILIEVEDSGKGMDEMTQLRLFEPFYTTKAGHTGIGLSAVYGTVERAHGRIAVDSEVGKGTTFRIQLPLEPAESDTLEPPWGF